MSNENGITPEQLGKAMSHAIRVGILRYLVEHEQGSPAEISRALEEPIGNVSYHVRFLLDEPGLVDGPDGTRVPGTQRGWRAIDLVDTRQRRGAIEHYYALRGEWRTVVAERLGINADATATKLRAMIEEAAAAVAADGAKWAELACGQDTEEAEESGRLGGYVDGLRAALAVVDP